MHSSTNGKRILEALAYFDIFNHPLTKQELLSIEQAKIEETEERLQEYSDKKLCYNSSEYFSISSNIKDLVLQRIEKENRAKLYTKKLPFYANIIKSFPFVKGIAISGSLSKGVMHKDGDIDYFIITSKNRLWICRTLLILFKKIFLLNSRKYFCLNYFVDENNLEIVDKNIFTAVEVSYLLPIYNVELFEHLKKENDWTSNFFPASTNQIPLNEIKGEAFFKSILETAITGLFAEKLDLFFMKLTCKRWASKFNYFNKEKFELTMRSYRGISKHHPSDFQTKVLSAFQERMEQLNLKNEGSIYS